MNFQPYGILAVILVSFTSVSLLISMNWRLSIVLLAVQYVGVFILVGLRLPLEMAVVKLVAGWMSGAILGMAVISLPLTHSPTQIDHPDLSVDLENPKPWWSLAQFKDREQLSGLLFHLLAAILVGLTSLSLAPVLVKAVPGMALTQAWGSLILIGMGLLQLGFTAQVLPVIIGLLTFLSGFEVLYAAVESSTLVAGLLAGVTLGLALIGSYLLVAPRIEENE